MLRRQCKQLISGTAIDRAQKTSARRRERDPSLSQPAVSPEKTIRGRRSLTFEFGAQVIHGCKSTIAKPALVSVDGDL
jgi:hypothetical protein